MSFQTQTLAWSQADGTDVYTESDELIVVPPIAEIGAGASQIFRVTTRGAPAAQERAYRLIFEDVTDIVSTAHALLVSVNPAVRLVNDAFRASRRRGVVRDRTRDGPTPEQTSRLNID